MGEILEENIRSQVDSLLLVEQIEKLLATLTEREASVIRLRTMNEMSLGNIGKLWNVSNERIRQIELKALRKLRSPCRAKMLQEWLSDRWHSERVKREEEEQRGRDRISQEKQKEILEKEKIWKENHRQFQERRKARQEELKKIIDEENEEYERRRQESGEERKRKEAEYFEKWNIPCPDWVRLALHQGYVYCLSWPRDLLDPRYLPEDIYVRWLAEVYHREKGNKAKT